jgi:hypothetical protein
MPEPKKTKRQPKKKATPAATRTASPTRTTPSKTGPSKVQAKKVAVKKVAPAKAAVKKGAPAKAVSKKVAPKKAAARKAAPRKAAPAKAAPRKAAPRKAAPRKAAPGRAPLRKGAQPVALAPDPEGFFVARVRGEEAVRVAPHPMLETGGWEDETLAPSAYDEGLGELPWSYGDDALIALPRDPRTLFVYWDHARATLDAAFAGLEHPRAQIWLFVKGAGWERIRTIDFALESRGYYIHDLDPGRVYRAELHAVGASQDRPLPGPSNEVLLPPVGPSPVVDDRFVHIPWELPLPRLVGAGTPGGPFSEELRALLAKLSDWGRFQSAAWGGGGAGGMGGRPFSATTGFAGAPSSPSSPFRPPGGEGR